jgi:heptosyltransferase I
MSLKFPFETPPGRVCILRLSAIGDTCHVVPLLHRLQQAWPQTRFTWVIGRLEARLMSLLPRVEFITVDKRADRAARTALGAQLRATRFDLLLDLQVALRASLLARQIPARVKLGFDRARARELQWLFTTHRVPARSREHVLDSFQGFADALGLPATPLDHTLPLPTLATDYARALIPDGQATLVVSPCSSHGFRNWRPERYAAVIDHAQRDLGLKVILCGGPAPVERATGAAIEAASATAVINQIGRDTLPHMLALLSRATVLLSPDSGPAHMGTLAGVPVIGLYAATNPARSGPYLSRAWTIDRYDEAARRYLGRPAARLAWTRKIEVPGVMDLITVDDVKERLQALAAAGLLRSRA